MIDLERNGTIEFASGYVNDPLVLERLDQIGAYEFETICDGWRNLDPNEDVLDINDVPLTSPLFDFKDVYVVRYSSGSDPASTAEALETLEGVIAASPNYRVVGTSCSCPTGQVLIGDKRFPSTATDPGQWALHNPGIYADSTITAVEDVDINLPEAWKIHAAATKQVGVIDIGFDSDHVDIVDAVDAVNSTCFVGGTSCPVDGGVIAHGTSVASIIGAKANNGLQDCESDSTCVGVAGILGHPDSDDDLLVLIRISGAGTPLATAFANAIYYAADSLELPIVNMSVSVPDTHTNIVRNALRNAHQLGTLLVGSSGNSVAHASRSPQKDDRFVFGVGAAGIENEHHDLPAAGAFPTGRHIDVVAPAAASALFAVGSAAASQDTAYHRFHDTSAAAPHVAGSAGLVLSYVDKLTNEDLIEIIARQSRNIVRGGELASGYDDTTGFGLVRLDDALCWLTENEIDHGFATGWDDTSWAEGEVRTFRDLPGDAPGFQDYFTEVLRVRKYVTFDDYTGTTALDSLKVWARARQCTGWRDTMTVDVMNDLNWAGVDIGTITGDGCSLSTFFYKIYDDETGTTFKQWFPKDPFPAAPGEAKFHWHYTYLYPCSGLSRSEGVSAPDQLPGTFDVVRTGLYGLRIDVATEITLELDIFDVAGRLVSREVMPELRPGRHSMTWSRETQSGLRAAPGVYFARLTDGVRSVPVRLIVPR